MNTDIFIYFNLTKIKIAMKDKQIRERLENLEKQKLIDLIISNIPFQKYQELISKKGIREKIPVTTFTTQLFPLEAAARYLKDNLQKTTTETARILNKKPPAVSAAYKKSQPKKFIIKKTDVYIPLAEFKDNPSFSILEIVVHHLKNKRLRFVDIAKLLGRNPKTIWTVYQRALEKK